MDEMEDNNVAHERSASDICKDQQLSVDGHDRSLIQQDAAESPKNNPVEDMPQWEESTDHRRSNQRQTPTAKLHDDENHNLISLRRAVGYITSFMTKLSTLSQHMRHFVRKSIRKSTTTRSDYKCLIIRWS